MSERQWGSRVRRGTDEDLRPPRAPGRGFIWRLIANRRILSRSVTWSSLCILGKFTRVSMDRMDLIGAGASRKTQRGVRRLRMPLRNSR